jgi:hypothetical protein
MLIDCRRSAVAASEITTGEEKAPAKCPGRDPGGRQRSVRQLRFEACLLRGGYRLVGGSLDRGAGLPMDSCAGRNVAFRHGVLLVYRFSMSLAQFAFIDLNSEIRYD